MTDERDLHDANVDAAWRAHMHAAPPPALDAGILAAAHRAVQSAPRSADDARRPRHRAWVPLAVAATLGAIAFGVVQLAPHESDTLTSAVSDAPVVTARKQEAAPSPQAQAPRTEESLDRGGIAAQRAADPSVAQSTQLADEKRQRASEPRRAQREDVAAATPAAPAAATTPAGPVGQTAPAAPPPPVPPPASAASKEPATPAADAQRMRERQAFPAAVPLERKTAPLASPEAPAAPKDEDAAARLRKEPYADKLTANVAPAPPPAAAAPAPALRDAPVESRSGALRSENARAKVTGNRPPEEFVREIRRLRAEGHEADARLVLTAFRTAYADADAWLSDDLRAWAQTVARPPR